MPPLPSRRPPESEARGMIQSQISPCQPAEWPRSRIQTWATPQSGQNSRSHGNSPKDCFLKEGCWPWLERGKSASDLLNDPACLFRRNKQCGVSRIALRSAHLVPAPALGGIESLIHFIQEAGR